MSFFESAYFRTLYREIGRSPGRFVSILLLLMIGTGLFYGQHISIPSLQSAVDKYYDDTRLFDVWVHYDASIPRILKDSFENLPGIDGVQFERHSEAQAEWDGFSGTVQIFSIPEDGFTLNKPMLKEGRMPGAPGECLADAGARMKNPMKIGENVNVDGKEFTVVGTAFIPYYINYKRDSTKQGSGKTECFIMISESDFPEEGSSSDVFFTVKGTGSINCFSSKYDKTVTQFVEDMKTFLEPGADNGLPYKIIGGPYELRTRQSLYSYTNFMDDCENLKNMLSAIPMIIFFIALFICSASMIRVVDAKKTDVIVMQSLGAYGKVITFPFYFFSVTACLLGLITGCFIGRSAIPAMVAGFLSDKYPGLPPVIVQDSAAALFITFFLSISWSMMATFVAIQKLKRKPGFKEYHFFSKRSSFFTKAFSFNLQVSFKNIARYKWRSLISLICVILSVSVLFFVFTSIKVLYDTLDVQYKVLQNYDVSIGLSKPGHDEQILEILEKEPSYRDSIFVFQKLARMENNDNELYAKMVIPDDPKKSKEYFLLRNEKSLEPVALPDDFAVISVKAAKLLGVGIGSEISVRFDDINTNDEISMRVKITDIIESHFVHEIFIAPSIYEQYCESNSYFQTLYVKMPQFTDDVSEELFKTGNVESVAVTDDIISEFVEVRKIMQSMTYVIAVISIIFITIVIYNISILARMERSKEINILEQIGYDDFNIHLYLFREMIFIMFVGILTACIINVLGLNTFISFIDSESVSYLKKIYPEGFVFSILLTIAELTITFWWDYIYGSVKHYFRKECHV